jgi:hypothetical protein
MHDLRTIAGAGALGSAKPGSAQRVYTPGSIGKAL